MIRALFNLGDDSTRPGIVRRKSAQPQEVSRRDFLTLGRGAHRADGTWRVTIDRDNCTDCNACTRICNEDALNRNEDDLHVVYSITLAACTGCGGCKTVCAAKAVSVTRESDRRDGVAEIAKLSKARCSGCGQSQAGLVDGVCPICQSIGSMQMLLR
jgi:Pyruvate/2-oxoacid:ferredoxin oxidoreductase delta subunit